MDLRRRLSASSPSRRLAYYSLVQASYAGLAGAFEMPMAIRLSRSAAGVALVYAFYFAMIYGGFVLGSLACRDGKVSRGFRLGFGTLAGINLLGAALFPWLARPGVVIAYFTLRGMAEGLYWSSRHPALLATVGDAGRDEFALRVQSLSVFLQVLFPLVSGALVTYLGGRLWPGATALPPGYVVVFGFSGLILLGALYLAPELEIPPARVSFRRAFSLARLPEAATWRAYLGLTGLAGTAVSVGAGILTFGILRAEFRIGALNAGVGLLSGLFFVAVRRYRMRRPGMRLQGVLLGAGADTLSRLIYALVPVPLALGLKSLLDAFAVPLKSLFGENLLRRHQEGLAARSGASLRELLLFQELRLLLARLSGCALIGGLALLAARLAAAGIPLAPDLAVRAFLAAAGPAAFMEFLFLRRLSALSEGLPAA